MNGLSLGKITICFYEWQNLKLIKYFQRLFDGAETYCAKVDRIYKDKSIKMDTETGRIFNLKGMKFCPHENFSYGTVSIQTIEGEPKIVGSKFSINLNHEKSNFEGENIVLGKIEEGLNVLDVLNNYSSKFGRTTKRILIMKYTE